MLQMMLEEEVALFDGNLIKAIKANPELIVT